MEEKYIKETSIQEKNDEEKNRELIKSIILTKRLLTQAHKNFEFAENDLIDYYSYDIKAKQTKLDYLIKQAKFKGLTMNTNLKIKINEDEEVS